MASEVLYLEDGRTLVCDSYQQTGGRVLVFRGGDNFSLPERSVDWRRTEEERTRRIAEQKLRIEERAKQLAAAEAKKPPVYSGLIVKKLDVKNAELEDLLRHLCDLAGLDLVVDRSVSGKKATYFLKNIRWEDALQMVLADANLGYRILYGNLIVNKGTQPGRLGADNR